MSRRNGKGELRRLEEMASHERLLAQVGITPVAGVDEAGMGPLAGPVVAAAVMMPLDVLIEGLDDSKTLTRAVRERLDREIRRAAIGVGVGVVEPPEIDVVNIFQAGLRAMRLAVASLEVAPRHVLVDARTIPDVEIPQTAFVKGDRRVYSIAAASVIAKVHRDRLMEELERSYPGYGFGQHSGYPTAEHRDAIRRLGPCPAHRRSFTLL